MQILDKINNSNDLKKLNYQEKEILAKEIRDFLIDNLSKTGGHLASNLGVVELTMSILSSFNLPNDKLIWDVGHQSYVHKILTGRKDKFNTLRKMDGLSGFPKTNESVYDSENTGHSSTSISFATGLARARDIKNENFEIISVIGDGSLTGGLALEALNDIGSSNLNVKVVLNDNEMSISKNVGGIPLLLSKLRTRKLYLESNSNIKKAISKIPFIGKYLVLFIQKIKRIIKQMFIKNMYFEDIGFTYLGPIDGHDLKNLDKVFNYAKEINGPVLIHILTTKGKGYSYAEENPSKYHAVSPFDIKTGKSLKEKKEDYSSVVGKKLVELAKKDQRVVAITAAMKDGTGLSDFAKKYPNRFFDVGICEEHAITSSCGLSSNGMKPYVLIYSSFLQRGYDELLHDLCLSNLNVTIGIDRTGIVGNDGETHQGIFTFSYLKTLPNMVVLAPKDYKELEMMLDFSLEYNYPLSICYPRGVMENNFNKYDKIVLGKSEILCKGNDITIIAIGKMVNRAIEVSNILSKEKISCEVINARFLKPIDKDIIKSMHKTKLTITIEDNIINNGLYSSILELDKTTKIIPFAYPNTFIKQGNVDEIEKKYQMDTNSIINKIKEEFK